MTQRSLDTGEPATALAERFWLRRVDHGPSFEVVTRSSATIGPRTNSRSVSRLLAERCQVQACSLRRVWRYRSCSGSPSASCSSDSAFETRTPTAAWRLGC